MPIDVSRRVLHLGGYWMMLTSSIENRGVAEALETFRSAFDESNVERLLDLFDDDAVFIGTSAAAATRDRQSIRSYFEDFFSGYAPTGLDFVSLEIQQLAGNVAVVSGASAYRWTQDGRPVSLPARFTLVLKRLADLTFPFVGAAMRYRRRLNCGAYRM